MVGKSTCGSGATGRNGTATSPTNPIAAIRSDVATGRWMNGSEIFITTTPLCRPQRRTSATSCYSRRARCRACARRLCGGSQRSVELRRCASHSSSARGAAKSHDRAPKPRIAGKWSLVDYPHGAHVPGPELEDTKQRGNENSDRSGNWPGSNSIQSARSHCQNYRSIGSRQVKFRIFLGTYRCLREIYGRRRRVYVVATMSVNAVRHKHCEK